MASHRSDPAPDPLAELRRAELLAHTRYPRLGPWYPVLTGLVVGLWVAGFALPRAAQIALWVGLAIVSGLAVGLYQRARGVQPDPRKAPGPIRGEMVRFAIGYVLFMVAVVVFWQILPWWVVAVAAAVSAVVCTSIYERRYAAAARQAEADAGIAPSTT